MTARTDHPIRTDLWALAMLTVGLCLGVLDLIEEIRHTIWRWL